MPRITPFRLAAACALAISLTLALAAGAAAKGFQAQLRVVGSGDKVLVEKPVATATTTLDSSPKAECFGKGSGGSGDPVTIKGNTAMGLLARASKLVASLRPLLISDSFDFGLALCGIGKSVAKGSSSWYLKINHKSLSVGGDAATIKPGDEVLWALAKAEAPDYEYPEELVLSAPNSVKPGMSFPVRVLSYDEKGKSKPAAGVKVTGAGAPTGADGRTTVTLTKPAKLIATAAAEIPSAREPVCIAGKCPK
ncbi:MAG TPA: hypothetical protein VN732_02865 [Solirubrobacterales bacterium]|nr:hypothetical protein [Solirubrobacterales bacterium]